ncbi:MAG: galactitol-1-phosphate 5-dehydrogenase [Eubacteriales bacterium]|nr:galactitol-1-phosphate 5-dehydrogenase [Eubacteriales bacterium]
MKAAVLHGNEDLRYEEYDTPVVRPGHVLVRVKASGICGSDIPRVLHHGAHSYPIVLGHEFSGVVEQVGEGVTGIAPGMRVSGAPLVPCMQCADCARGDYALCRHYSFIGSRQQGSFADYVLLPAQNVVPFGENVSFVQGALFEPSTVALHGLFQNHFRGGEHVAVLGGGTIGQFTAQWARIMGAKTVTVFDLNESRLEVARRLGSDAGILTSRGNFREEALAVTAGKGFGMVFETAGSPVTMRMAFELAANKAHVCFIGTPHTDLTFTPAQWECMNRKEFRLTGSWMSYSAPFPGREWQLTAHEFATGRLRFDEGLLHAVYPMEKAGEAFALYKTPGLVAGKLMLLNE